MIDPVIIVVALAAGLACRALRLPALIGYLAAGFLLHEIAVEGGAVLQVLSDLGVTLMLFTIGLKLQVGELARARIWGTTVLHMIAMELLFLGLLMLSVELVPALSLSVKQAALLAFAFSFSSTVFVIQILQERGEMASRHAALAIGVLIIQDLAAVLFLTISTGKLPQPEALLLLLLLPMRRVVLRMLSLAGHGELFTLFGLALALMGAQVFESVGIKGDLGALVIGAVLAGDQKSKELARNLLNFKDLFLVGFFLSIGLGGWPGVEVVWLALAIGILAILKPPLYFLLFTTFHTPPRTALLAAAALSNHSEFGLIVVALATSLGWVDPQWGAALSIAIAVSFVVASPMNGLAHGMYRRFRPYLLRFESPQLRETHPDTRDVRVLVLGMGNIGTGAYEAIAERYGWQVLGVDDNDRKLREHRAMHRRVAAADASDPDFWHRVALEEVELVMLALTNHQENMRVAALLRRFQYQGNIAAVIRFAEEARELEAVGISAFNLYAQAGAGFAEHAVQLLDDLRPPDRPPKGLDRYGVGRREPIPFNP